MLKQLGLTLPSAGLITLLTLGAVWAGTKVDIPKPTDRLKPPPPPPVLDQSVLSLEVLLPAKELALDVNQVIPAVNAREDNWDDAALLPGREDVRFLYRLLRGPFRYQMNENSLDLTFDEVRYRIWARQTRGDSVRDGRCGHGEDPPKRMQIAMHSALSWSETWHLQSKTTVDPPVFVDPCLLQGMDVDATPFLRSILQPRLLALAEKIDRKVQERTRSNQRAETVWRKLREPMELAPNRWLTFNLRDALVSPISSRGGLTILAAVNLIGQPEIVNEKPPVPDVPLPALRTAPARTEGFRLWLPLFADYDRINKKLARKLVGQSFETPFGEPLTVAGIELYGSGDKLIVALRVTGGADGVLYATGMPVFDEPTRSLMFKDLDFTVDTRNVLVRSANRFWYDAIREKLQDEVNVDLAEPLTLMQSRLNGALTRELAPGVRMEGALKKLIPRGIYPVDGGIEVHLVAQGAIRVLFQ